MLIAAVGVHRVDLLRAVAVTLEDDAAPVRRVAGSRINRVAVGELKGAPTPQVHGVKIGVAVALQAHDNALAVRGKARGKGHARKGTDGLLLPSLNVEEVDLWRLALEGHVGDV